MSSIVSILLEDNVIKTIQKNAQLLQLSETDYIKEAIVRMNQAMQHQELALRLERGERQSTELKLEN